MHIHDDILQVLERRKGVILVLIDLTAAFDNVGHAMLLKLIKSIGLCDSALAWIASYLSDRTLAVKIEGAISRRLQLNCGVPQRSVLGPLLFTIYRMPLTALFARHHLTYHMYADDTHLYVDFPRNQPCDADIATRRIDIERWMTAIRRNIIHIIIWLTI